MSDWKIKEISFYSLTELNTYIAENNITPANVLKYETVFDQLKQTMRYLFTYWTTEE